MSLSSLTFKNLDDEKKGNILELEEDERREGAAAASFVISFNTKLES